MQEAGKVSRRSQRNGASREDITPLNQASPEGKKIDAPAVPTAVPLAPPVALEPGELLSAEQERLMIDHLPIVRFIARRIHERLPQHVPIEDLYSAGVVGLLDAFGKFDPTK